MKIFLTVEEGFVSSHLVEKLIKLEHSVKNLLFMIFEDL